MIIIVVNVKKTTESSVSILLRILTNYTQIITSTISFSSSHPELLTDALAPIKSVGDSSTAFMSFDCFITDNEVKGPFPSNVFFKLFLLIFLPLIIFSIVALIWITLYSIRKSWVTDLRRYLVISFISVVFLLHPKLAQSGIDVFRCIQVEEDTFKVRIDSAMDCYSSEHIKWCFILGVPILIFWVILLPILALILMYRNVRIEDDNNHVQKYFLILYQGLKTKHFYWEFVNSSRKISILIAFLLPPKLQILFSLVILISTWRLQSYLQPYKDHDKNEIEIFGVNVGIITLSCGMVYNSPDINNTLNSCLLILMLILNVIFIAKWIYLMILSLSDKYELFRTLAYFIRKFLLFKSVTEELETPKKHKKAKKQKKKLFNIRKGRRARLKNKNKLKNVIIKAKKEPEKNVSEIFRVKKMKSTPKRGQVSGSDQRMIHGVSMEKHNERSERRSSEISKSDQSKIEGLLRAMNPKPSCDQIIEEQKDEMLITTSPPKRLDHPHPRIPGLQAHPHTPSSMEDSIASFTNSINKLSTFKPESNLKKSKFS